MQDFTQITSVSCTQFLNEICNPEVFPFFDDLEKFSSENPPQFF